MANFMLKIQNFRYHGNKGRSGVNFNDIVKLRDLAIRKPRVWCKICGLYLL